MMSISDVYMVHRYINRHNVDTAKAFFPNMVLKELDAGHWGESS